MLKKITVGFVIQDFDEKTGKCVSQEFVAGEQVDWENEKGETINPFEFSTIVDGDFNFFPFRMVQPDTVPR